MQWKERNAIAHTILLCFLDLRQEAYIVTNSIRHLDELYRSKFISFWISNFEQSVLFCIEVDLRNQTSVEKRLTRSTNSTFFSRTKFSKFSNIFENFVRMLMKFRQKFSKNSSKFDELIRQFVILGDELEFISILASRPWSAGFNR